MIYVVFGDIGSGKTLHCLEWMEKATAVGRPVYTNIWLTPACPFHDRVAFMDDNEYCVLRGNGPTDPNYQAWWHYVDRGSLVIVDEADLYFDCSEHSNLGKDVRGAHKMIRKLDVDVVYIVQNVQNLYVRIRRLAGRFIGCEWNYRTQRLFRYCPRSWSRFLRSEFGDEHFRVHRGDGYISWNEATRMFGWYHTKQLLGDLSLYRNKNIGGGGDDISSDVSETAVGDGQRGNGPAAPAATVEALGGNSRSSDSGNLGMQLVVE